MKKVILILLVIVSAGVNAQVKNDSITLKQLKEEIKQELRAEFEAKAQSQKKPLVDVSKFSLRLL